MPPGREVLWWPARSTLAMTWVSLSAMQPAVCSLTLVADGLAQRHDARRRDAANAIAAAERVLAAGSTDDDRDDLVWP